MLKIIVGVLVLASLGAFLAAHASHPPLMPNYDANGLPADAAVGP